MKMGSSITRFSLNRPWLVTGFMITVTLCLALLAALPSIWPETFKGLNPLKVDTDPENMLPKEESVRAFHDSMKKEMALYDIVVLGVVNESHPNGVFNTESLRKIYELTEYAKTLRWPDEKHPDKLAGVIKTDLIAPSTVDSIEQGGLGSVRFEWLMRFPPNTEEEALAIRKKAANIPFLNGTLISEDGKAVCLYLPLTSKDISYKIYSKLREKIDTFSGNEQYYITGLPVAEDTFGVEMFKQMAISAPLAMLIIFLLMLFFFRKPLLIISPMIVAMVSVVCTMGLLIITGNTVHIMSSMIPIFIMPIAVLDAVHILSDFFDRYQETKDQEETVVKVMDTLFTPMLYTSLTTAVGFASLALTPIPPVQVFGLFIAFGVMVAWVFTVTFIPAFIMFIPKKSLENFGASTLHGDRAGTQTPLTRFLAWLGEVTFHRAKLIMAATAILTLIAVYGIYQIKINDNPIKWFNQKHPIRVADKVLNEHFGGTYMGYLALESQADKDLPQYVAGLSGRIDKRIAALKDSLPTISAAFENLRSQTTHALKSVSSKKELLERLVSFADGQFQNASGRQYDAWDEVLLFLDQERQLDEVFKQPEALRYIAELQKHLLTTGVVGKSNSLADLVKTVYRELLLGDPQKFKIPDTANAVAQCLITYQNSHRPQDLWHFVTPDYTKTVLWVQLKSGDNLDMANVVRSVDEYIAANPAPFNIKHQWFGLTYINVVWQNKMVSGMLEAFLGSFLIILLMMTILYRSALWGMLSMVPLTVTIGLIYGVIGLIGKDYDMPVAVLSSLSLGLAVDYAIHFLSRSRQLRAGFDSWAQTAGPVFGEPARAIARNVVVIGVGFLPLLAASLVPYQTVGIFIAAILLTAGIASLLILPSMISILERWLFPTTRAASLTCNCATCIILAVIAVALAAINVHDFLSVGWNKLTWFSLTAILISAAGCALASRREKCLNNKNGDVQ